MGKQNSILPKTIYPAGPETVEENSKGGVVSMPAKHKRSNRFWFKIWVALISLFVLVLIASGAYYLIIYSKNKKALNVSNSFVNDLRKSDAGSAYSLTSTTYRTKTSEETLKLIVNSPVFQKIINSERSYSYKKISNDGPNSRLQVTYKFSVAGSDYNAPIIVSQINGNWQVSSASIVNTSLLQSLPSSSQ